MLGFCSFLLLDLMNELKLTLLLAIRWILLGWLLLLLRFLGGWFVFRREFQGGLGVQ